VLARLLAVARPYRSRYIAGFILLLLTNGLSLWVPWLLRDAIRALEQGADLRVIRALAAGIVAVAVGQSVVRTLSRRAMLGASRHVAYDVRDRFFEKLQQLGPSFYDRERTGDIMSRGVNDVRLIQAFFGPGALNLINTAIVYVAVLTLLLRIDVVLTLISLVLYPPLFYGVNRLSRRVYARSRAVQEQLAEISNRAQENISGIQQVKIFAQEEREIAAFNESSAEYLRLNLSMAALRGGMMALIGAIAGLGTLVVLFVGGRFVISGRMDLGDFVAFNAYLGLLVWPTIALGWITNTIQRGIGAMERIDDMLQRESDIAPGAGVPARDVVPDGDIEIRGLSFGYAAPGERRLPAALHDVNLTIEQGSRVALVGPVGSGKSTLANLLVRFYPAPSGTILVGGVEINEIPLALWRRSIGYAPQESFLFSRTLRENITFGRPDATDDELARAIELAHLTADLESFPDGLETMVGERGYTLSGGQRQRATLARAVVNRPRLLILDDSLSSVDADTERAILTALHGRRREGTLLLISHRPSTLAEMDRIVVLDDGRVVEDGTHEELLSCKGLYAQLFRRYLLEQKLTG